jgi:hypothetical protein
VSDIVISIIRITQRQLLIICQQPIVELPK